MWKASKNKGSEIYYIWDASGLYSEEYNKNNASRHRSCHFGWLDVMCSSPFLSGACFNSSGSPNVNGMA